MRFRSIGAAPSSWGSSISSTNRSTLNGSRKSSGPWHSPLIPEDPGGLDAFQRRCHHRDFGPLPGDRVHAELTPDGAHAMAHAAQSVAAQGSLAIRTEPHAIVLDEQVHEILRPIHAHLDGDQRGARM